MKDHTENLKKMMSGIDKCKDYFIQNVQQSFSPVHIFTHIDTDGISSGAILGKTLYRENLPFQISILRQLEMEEIDRIVEEHIKYNNFMIFTDFGSGQYLELEKKISENGICPFIILDHHLPQNISNKEETEMLEEIKKKQVLGM